MSHCGRYSSCCAPICSLGQRGLRGATGPAGTADIVTDFSETIIASAGGNLTLAADTQANVYNSGALPFPEGEDGAFFFVASFQLVNADTTDLSEVTIRTLVGPAGEEVEVSSVIYTINTESSEVVSINYAGIAENGDNILVTANATEALTLNNLQASVVTFPGGTSTASIVEAGGFTVASRSAKLRSARTVNALNARRALRK